MVAPGGGRRWSRAATGAAAAARAASGKGGGGKVPCIRLAVYLEDDYSAGAPGDRLMPLG